jgi:hypothetical protein
MKAREWMTAALLVIAPLTMAPSAWAQRADEGPSPPPQGRFGDPTLTGRNLQNFVYGVIKSVGPSEIVCDKTEFGDNQPFKLDKKTKFFRDTVASTPDALKVGDQAWIKIRKEKKTGDLMALVVVTGQMPANSKIK